jgi:type IV pilus assembly protein PilV
VTGFNRAVICREHGFGLIEVLIAILVLAIGLVAVSTVQTRSLNRANGTLKRTAAFTTSSALAEAMRVNASAARAGAYETRHRCTDDSTSEADTLAKADLNRWFEAMRTLGGAEKMCGEVHCGQDSCLVSVAWDDFHAEGGQAEVPVQFQLGAAL